MRAKTKIFTALSFAILAILFSSCAETKKDMQDSADYVTGKKAIKEGEKARKVIDGLNADREKQMKDLEEF